MLLALVLTPSVFAQSAEPHITFTHGPIRAELEQAEAEKQELLHPSLNMSEGEMKARDRQIWSWEHQKAATRSVDEALTWLMPTVEACYAGKPAASAAVHFVVSERAIVTQVKAMKNADPALVECLSTTFLKKPIPVITWTLDVVADYTFDAPAGIVAPVLPENVDLDRGIGQVTFGDTPDKLTSARQVNTHYDVSFYAQEYDHDVQVFGVEVASIQYVFSPDGFAGAVLLFSGDENAYALRQRLQQRYGNPHWDPVTKSFYWRGKGVMIGTLQNAESHLLQIQWIDIERMRKAQMVSRLPGDANDTAATGTLPKILRE